MQSKLLKAWGPYAVGTIVVDNKEEAASTPGALRVNPARFAALTESGHLAAAEPARPIPEEVRTSETGRQNRRSAGTVTTSEPSREPFATPGEAAEPEEKEP